MTTAINPATATPATASMAAPKMLGADFDTFVKLLVTQVRNQDPLEPQDPTQYTQQLATFSQVEQAVATNNKLDAMLNRLGADALGQLAPLIGREVRAAAGPFAPVRGIEVVDGAPMLRAGDALLLPADIAAVR